MQAPPVRAFQKKFETPLAVLLQVALGARRARGSNKFSSVPFWGTLLHNMLVEFIALTSQSDYQ